MKAKIMSRQTNQIHRFYNRIRLCYKTCPITDIKPPWQQSPAKAHNNIPQRSGK